MATSTISTTRRVVLDRYRIGREPCAGITSVKDVPVAAPQPGQAHVRVTHFLIHSVASNMMEDRKDFPMPKAALGGPLWTMGVGEVVSAPSGELAPGTVVAYLGGWDAEIVTDVDSLFVLPEGLPAPYYALSQGITAYRGMVGVADVKAGDVVFVSGASGAVGAMAGQIAKASGAARVIGSTLGADNAAYIRKELGFDAAIDAADGDILEQLRAAAPNGIDVYFETVGGRQFEAAVKVASHGARFALCGAYVQQFGSDPDASPRLDIHTAVVKNLKMEGFTIIPTQESFTAWNEQFRDWLSDGAITFPHILIKGGLEVATASLDRLLAGEFRGSVILEV